MNIDQINTVVVVGAGIMGKGIAQGFAEAGLTVRVLDIKIEALERCQRQISANLDAFNEFGLLNEAKDSILKRISFHEIGNLVKAVGSCDFIVEAMPEILKIKQDLFSQLDYLPDKIILASNTSSITISDISQKMQSPQRLVGVHYFNPAHIIPAVEIHRGQNTSDSAIDTTMALMAHIGKKPILVRKEIPGFIINRLTGAMEREIDYLLDEGVVSPEDLDTAVKASYGFRLACLGPMEAEDMIGLDTAARASGNIFPSLSNADLPSPQLLAKVERGDLGIKSGSGWYKYPESHRESIIEDNNRRLLRQLKLFNSQL